MPVPISSFLARTTCASEVKPKKLYYCSASDLMSLWRETLKTKSKLKDQEDKWYTIKSFSLEQKKRLDSSQSLILDEITDRFLQRRSLSTETDHLLETLNAEILENIIKELLNHPNPAKGYDNLKHTVIRAWPNFDQKFMTAIIKSPDFDRQIQIFFKKAREHNIVHEHLYDVLSDLILTDGQFGTIQKEALKSKAVFPVYTIDLYRP